MKFSQFILLFMALTATAIVTPLGSAWVHAQAPSVGPGRCYGNCPDQNTPVGGKMGTQTAPFQQTDRNRALLRQADQALAEGRCRDAERLYRDANRIQSSAASYLGEGKARRCQGRLYDAMDPLRDGYNNYGCQACLDELKAVQAELNSRIKRQEDERRRKAEEMRIVSEAFAKMEANALESRWRGAVEGVFQAASNVLYEDIPSVQPPGGLRLPSPQESLYPKGMVGPELVDMSDLNLKNLVVPAHPTGSKPKQPGLKIKSVPLPAAVAYHPSKPMKDIFYNALLSGGPSLRKAKKNLEDYLRKYDPQEKNQNAQSALRVLQVTVKALDDNARKKSFEPRVEDPTMLLEAIAVWPRMPWPGPTKGPDRIPEPGVLQEKTLEYMLDALYINPNNWQGSFYYLAQLAEDPNNPDREAAKKALARLRDIREEILKSEKVP